MPRLTTRTYLQQHHQLRQYWRSSENAFFLLSAKQQWDLYAFYFPHEPFTDPQLVAARQHMTAFDPSLPQRAGRAFTRLARLSHDYLAYQQELDARPARKKGAAYRVRILGEVHPEIDVDKFVKILINYERRDP